MRIETALRHPVVTACSIGMANAHAAYQADPTPENRARLASEERRLKSIVESMLE